MDMNVRACSVCAFSMRDLQPDRTLGLFCHRYPPQLVAVFPRPGVIAYQPMYPMMGEDTWCGEFKESANGRPKDSGTA